MKNYSVNFKNCDVLNNINIIIYISNLIYISISIKICQNSIIYFLYFVFNFYFYLYAYKNSVHSVFQTVLHMQIYFF